MMRASRFEFEKRFWIIGAIFFVGFALFSSDISAIAALHSLLSHSAGVPTNFARAVVAAGALLVFFAAALRTWASAYLRSDIVHDTAQHSEALVADGPFRFTRNPLYLANLPMAFGIGLLASRSGCIFIVAANWVFVYRLIGREEENLRESLGESYRAYCRAVPRFWPSLTAKLPASGRPAHWAQAFAGESFIWIFGVAELAIAAALNARIGIGLFIVGFIVHLMTNAWLKRQRQN